jgi:glycosyltransferase involved in cell wall biosynthesis
MHKRILFLTLRVFSATGGIEKVCSIIGKAFYEMTFDGATRVDIYSSHDNEKEASSNRYFPQEIFTCFNQSKFSFLWHSLKRGCKSDVIVLSHVNLLLAGWLIKKIAPSKKIMLLAHGIEVWQLPLGYKKKMLSACDTFLCVSQFTKDQMIAKYNLDGNKCIVLNNCLDPYLPTVSKVFNRNIFRKKYNLTEQDFVVYTLTRMAASERYKGYDRVIEAVSLLKVVYPQIKYVIGGKADNEELKYINQLILKLDVADNVILAGFIADDEMAEHFAMSDLYIMPSYNEGFGIVFIEAMHYGLPVIAGNKDGSADALVNGRLGTLIDPMDVNAIRSSIIAMISKQQILKPELNLLQSYFGYQQYKNQLQHILSN